MASAIRRSLSPQAYSKRRTFRIFRIGALSAGISAPLDWQSKGAPRRPSFTEHRERRIAPSGWPTSIEDGRPACVRLGGRLGPDYGTRPAPSHQGTPALVTLAPRCARRGCRCLVVLLPYEYLHEHGPILDFRFQGALKHAQELFRVAPT